MQARSETDKELKVAKANLYSCYKSARLRCKKIEKAKWEIAGYKPQNWATLTEYNKKKFEEVRQHLLRKLDKEGLPSPQKIQTYYTERYVKTIISRAMKSNNRERAIKRIQDYVPKREHDQDELNEIKIRYMESYLSLSEMTQFKSCLENGRAASEEASIADREMKSESDMAQEKPKHIEESRALSSVTPAFSSTGTILSFLASLNSRPSAVRESVSSQDQQKEMQIQYNNFIALINHFPGIIFSDTNYTDDVILNQLKNIYEKLYEKKFESQNVKKHTLLYEGLSSLQIETHELISQLCDSNNRVSFINTTAAQLENLKEILITCSENIKSFAEKADYKIHIDEATKTCSAEYNFSKRHFC